MHGSSFFLLNSTREFAYMYMCMYIHTYIHIFVAVGQWLCMECCVCAKCGSERGRGDMTQWTHQVSH